jgi:hypothetical protein
MLPIQGVFLPVVAQAQEPQPIWRASQLMPQSAHGDPLPPCIQGRACPGWSHFGQLPDFIHLSVVLFVQLVTHFVQSMP